MISMHERQERDLGFIFFGSSSAIERGKCY